MKKTLGRYEILGVLGRGSMGVVYKGMDPQIHKLVAIKTMNQKLLSQPEMQERFYREGAILGKLTHRNIITVYTVGQDADICYIAMEYLEGTSLDKILSTKNPVHMRRSLEIISQVCEGVHAAHQHSVIHRDIKPANIFLLEEDHVKVLDFGVAHFQDSRLTNSGMLLGTVNYMAPEQITGDGVDHRSDIFSIGVILYQLLSGIHPFLGTNISQTMMRLVNQDTPAIENLEGDLQKILDRALAKKKDQRYQDLRELSADLREILKRTEFAPLGDESLPPTPTPFLHLLQEEDHGLIEDQASMILDQIRLGNHLEAEQQIQKLALEFPQAKQLTNLRQELKKVQDLQEQKFLFLKQLTQETLKKANAHMAERHYIVAIELCDRVLKHSPESQDAKVIRATSIKKLEEFIRQTKSNHSKLNA